MVNQFSISIMMNRFMMLVIIMIFALKHLKVNDQIVKYVHNVVDFVTLLQSVP